jgi:Restriction endonuclease
MDETEREPLLRERIKTMPPERFEQLVYELAHREDQRVERLEHPDGGADTILPRGQGEAERVWQAKRYPKAINWGKCEKSLADAIKRWRPARVTFASRVTSPRNRARCSTSGLSATPAQSSRRSRSITGT